LPESNGRTHESWGSPLLRVRKVDEKEIVEVHEQHARSSLNDQGHEAHGGRLIRIEGECLPGQGLELGPVLIRGGDSGRESEVGAGLALLNGDRGKVLRARFSITEQSPWLSTTISSS
jgi:hypothetical protein